MTPNRRVLKFTNLDDAVADAEQLRDGYEALGKWDYGQVLGHLTAWLRYPIDGYPPLPFALKPVFWILKKTIATKMLNKAIETEKMGEGSGTAPQSIPKSGIDPREAFDAYRDAVRRWTNHHGKFHTSPLFGVMEKDKLTQLHRVHAMHHLSFLVPKV